MNSNSITVIIGQRLRIRRNQLGYSQNLTSEKADMHPTYVGQIERGEKKCDHRKHRKAMSGSGASYGGVVRKYRQRSSFLPHRTAVL